MPVTRECEARAELLRSLGHPVRIRILELLVDGSLPVRELRDVLGVEASSLSHHLAVLRRAGIITARREGGVVVYALGPAQVAGLLDAVRRILASVLAGRVELAGRLRRAGSEPRGG